MAAFATKADLASFTGDDSLDSARGTLLLEQASNVIRSHCRQTFDRVANDEVELRGTWSHKLKLPERPVASVSKVLVGAVEVETYRLVRDTLYRTGPEEEHFNVDVGRGRSWGGPAYTVTVTYTHGFASADIPGVLETVCLQVAARAAGNPQHLGNFQGDGITLGFDRAGPFGLTSAEQSLLGRFRHELAS